MSQAAWDYLVGGVESETTMRRNRLALDRLALRPRALLDVSKIDPSTTLLGHRLRSPVILAPIGSMQHLSPDGALGFAEAATHYGTIMSMSIMTPPSLEVVAGASGGPKIFQLYRQGDLAWVRDLLRRVREAGYAAVCLTVDTPYHSRRDRSLFNPMPPPRRAGARPHLGPNYLASVTWNTVASIRDICDMPFMIKGITTAQDASLAIDHGLDCVWVSNHGGRQLDHAQGTLEVLPEIVEAVDGRAEVIFDGGVLRGTDVIKALALGARAVAIGKLQGWAMAAGGVDGLLRALEILEDEITTSMGLLGVNCVEQVTPDSVVPAERTAWPHEMSTWVNLPGERLL
jgi:glycolate oxidase